MPLCPDKDTRPFIHYLYHIFKGVFFGGRVEGTEYKIGNLSRDVFEPRTSTRSCIFSSLEHFDIITFVTSNRRH